MYSIEIDRLLRENNFVISAEQYKSISDVNICTQISTIKYDAFNNMFEMTTNDGYWWQFYVYRKE